MKKHLEQNIDQASIFIPIFQITNFQSCSDVTRCMFYTIITISDICNYEHNDILTCDFEIVGFEHSPRDYFSRIITTNWCR